MELSTAELDELARELLDAWDADGHPTEMSQPRARLGKPIGAADVARMECVVGLARHVHETTRAIRLLLDNGHLNAAVPLVRLVYECALTATWLVQSEDHNGIKAFLHEYTRQQSNLQSALTRAVSATFRSSRGAVADTNMDEYLGSSDNARRFDLICEDLEPGGADAYIFYKILSSISHAGVRLVDLYFSAPPRGQVVPPPRQIPDAPLDPELLLFLASASMVWSGRAVSYISKNKTYRSMLRRAARQLEIKAELHLSAAYSKRHGEARRRARPPRDKR
ncbi:DUF5677 domain-containing protein [Agrococcus sp. KRD186]|uniref:DUF5677 domain-containing protein n=1 Tax=Agrococcus sp. KRD186 TaxID=2729730 RepID=UPI0019D2862F|nr:DUF5677 domain-containing protein [Agrococcus sp. KRD186]